MLSTDFAKNADHELTVGGDVVAVVAAAGFDDHFGVVCPRAQNAHATAFFNTHACVAHVLIVQHFRKMKGVIFRSADHTAFGDDLTGVFAVRGAADIGNGNNAVLYHSVYLVGFNIITQT